MQIKYKEELSKLSTSKSSSIQSQPVSDQSLPQAVQESAPALSPAIHFCFNAGKGKSIVKNLPVSLYSVYNSQNDQTITYGEKRMKTWQLQHAKNHLSEVVRNALNEGPQAITLHGKPSAVVISFDEYNKAMNVRKPCEPLSSFFHNSPLRNSGIDLKRSKDLGRSEVIL